MGKNLKSHLPSQVSEAFEECKNLSQVFEHENLMELTNQEDQSHHNLITLNSTQFKLRPLLMGQNSNFIEKSTPLKWPCQNSITKESLFRFFHGLTVPISTSQHLHKESLVHNYFTSLNLSCCSSVEWKNKLQSRPSLPLRRLLQDDIMMLVEGETLFEQVFGTAFWFVPAYFEEDLRWIHSLYVEMINGASKFNPKPNHNFKNQSHEIEVQRGVFSCGGLIRLSMGSTKGLGSQIKLN
ncbi:hypothetical protein RND71_019153 [Anisodus tanguticus]|uniref:Uncharacterized protein n=1 Tax=Anisodus tanguticus TaxID=243964 RepID=A0AAE1S0E0_9SOLA|nr:hypothetical protein RND71_019153 [Anisodus tanguticus]